MSRQFILCMTVGVLIPAVPSAVAQTVPVGYRVDPVVTGLATPTTMAFLGPDDFFVLEKDSGMVKRVRSLGPTPTVEVVLDLNVSSNSEQGLLGIALPVDFAQSGAVYLYYTNSSPLQNRIARYTWNGSALTSPVILASLSAASGTHNGGVLAVGPDGMLYAVIGDQGHFDRTQNNTQTATISETGVFMRLRPSDGVGPTDNPFSGMAGWQRVYACGIRNCFGMAFDPISGVLWEAENGPNDNDEVNRIVPGANGGWSMIHGPDSRDSDDIADLVMNPGATYVDPAFSWFDTGADGHRFSTQRTVECDDA